MGVEQLLIFLVGILGGIVGSVSSGGGIITIPFLLFLGYQPVEVVGTTRIASFFGGLTSVFKYGLKGLVVKKYLWLFAPSIAAGIVGPFLLPKLDSDLIVYTIGIAMLALAAVTLLSGTFGINHVKTKKQSKEIGAVLIFFAMLFAVMFGAGGGAMVIAIMVLCFGMKIKQAAPTGMLIWLSGTAVASGIYFANGSFVGSLLPYLVAGSLIGGYFGASYFAKKDGYVIKLIFGSIVLLAGIKTLLF